MRGRFAVLVQCFEDLNDLRVDNRLYLLRPKLLARDLRSDIRAEGLDRFANVVRFFGQ